jgi:hypothetical protein
MIQHIITGVVALLALGGLGSACWSIMRTHDEIRSRNQHLAEQVDTALNQGIKLTR